MTESEADVFIRRFDDLGRIGIPKELRRQLFGTPEKSEGMPMEIFMNKDDIVLRKYRVAFKELDCSKHDKEIYNKAIDDFVNFCEKQFTTMYGQRYVDMRDIVNIAEQLKEGGKNE